MYYSGKIVGADYTVDAGGSRHLTGDVLIEVPFDVNRGIQDYFLPVFKIWQGAGQMYYLFAALLTVMLENIMPEEISLPLYNYLILIAGILALMKFFQVISDENETNKMRLGYFIAGCLSGLIMFLGFKSFLLEMISLERFFVVTFTFIAVRVFVKAAAGIVCFVKRRKSSKEKQIFHACRAEDNALVFFFEDDQTCIEKASIEITDKENENGT